MNIYLSIVEAFGCIALMRRPVSSQGRIYTRINFHVVTHMKVPRRM